MNIPKPKKISSMAKHWSEVQDRASPIRPYLFDHFIAVGEMTLFTFPPQADALVYCLSLAAIAAAGSPFGVHGVSKGARVLAMVGNEANPLEMEKLQYALKSLKLSDRVDHETDLRFVHKSEKEQIFLDLEVCQERIASELEGCDTFIIYDCWRRRTISGGWMALSRRRLRC